MSHFALRGVALPEGDDPLGLWDLRPLGEVPFTEEINGAGLSWHVRLSGTTQPFSISAGEAQRLLQERLNAVQMWRRQLDLVEQRLVALEPTLAAYRAYSEFEGRPEAELLAAVEMVRSPATAFAAPDELTDEYRQLYEKGQALFRQFRGLLVHKGRVETQFREALIGLTAVDWKSDFETVWAEGATQAQMELHVTSVHLAMTSRQAFLELAAVVMSGALILAVKAVAPGGQLLLIPAVYRYVREVMKELEELAVQARIQ